MNPRAKQLLERARAADALEAGARERMLHELTSKLERGATALPEIDASSLLVPKASWLTKVVSSFVGKVGLSVLGALLIAGGVMMARRDAQPAATVPPMLETPVVAAPPTLPEPSASPPSTAPAATEPAAARRRRTEPPQAKRGPRKASSRVEAAAEPEPAQRTQVIAPAPVLDDSDEQAREQPPSAPEPEARAPARPPAPATTLDDELALLRRAYSELNAGRAERAFEVLDVHAERFPRGGLEEAREVARMLALCAMGKEPAAKARARQFLATRPDSPFAGRVRGICPATKTP